MTTYNAEDYARAQMHSTYPENTRSLAREFARLRIAHDARVTELLDANNRFEQRARDAEQSLRDVLPLAAAHLLTPEERASLERARGVLAKVHP